jgi:hypothetical protein
MHAALESSRVAMVLVFNSTSLYSIRTWKTISWKGVKNKKAVHASRNSNNLKVINKTQQDIYAEYPTY